MKYIQYTILSTLLSIGYLTSAQVTTLGVNYVVGIPTGNSANFTGATSIKGASFECTYVPNESFGISFEGGWNNFYEKIPTSTYTYNTLTVTGRQHRYLSCVPFFLSANYFLFSDALIKPYGAFGFGLLQTEERNEVGLYTLSTQAWQFGIKPEIGVAVELSETLYLKLSAKYYQTIKTEALQSQSFIGINMGLAFNVQQ